MPQNHEDYLDEVDEVDEAADPDEQADEDEYDELAERRSLGADPATDVADVAEQNRIVQLDEDEYRE
ncbi:hypothetical protein [Kitasatospora sp. NPDC015120]|uniref:hypothetical protein n=1 Tax=Kitasatospora sp. NPDC015120 TaxID=3364023 RepID=UPI0036F47EA7